MPLCPWCPLIIDLIIQPRCLITTHPSLNSGHSYSDPAPLCYGPCSVWGLNKEGQDGLIFKIIILFRFSSLWIRFSLRSIPETFLSMSRTVRSIPETVLSMSKTFRSISETVLSMSKTLRSVSETLSSMSRILRSDSETFLSISKTLWSISETISSMSKSLRKISKVFPSIGCVFYGFRMLNL